MTTYFFGREEVTAYLRDFLQRLAHFKPIPDVWCPLTGSGRALLEAMLDPIEQDYPQIIPKPILVPVGVKRNRQRRTLHFLDDTQGKAVRGRTVLIFDGAVHSGRLMAECVRMVLDKGQRAYAHTHLLLRKALNLSQPSGV